MMGEEKKEEPKAEEAGKEEKTDGDTKMETTTEEEASAKKDEKKDENAEEKDKATKPQDGKEETDATTKPEIDKDLIPKVAERLEFFLSDANLRNDYYMRTQYNELDEKTEKPKLAIKVETFLKCNTVKKLTTDPKVILAAAKSLDKVLTIVNDEKSIGRVEPFTKDKMGGGLQLSLHIKNIPTKGHGSDKTKRRYAVNKFDIKDLFDPIYGTVSFVKLRFEYEEPTTPVRGSKRKSWPKGSAIVEFETKEQVEKAAAETATIVNGEAVEPKRKLILIDNELEIELLEAYVKRGKERKAKEEAMEEEEKSPESDEKKRPRDEKNDNDDEKKKVYEEFKLDWKPGCVIQFKGLSNSDCSREALLEALSSALDKTVDVLKSDKVWVDYSRGQVDGAIRLPEPDYANVKELAEKFSSGAVEICSKKVESAIVLEGEEEENYWKDFIAFKNKQKKHKFDERNSRKHYQKRRRYNNKR